MTDPKDNLPQKPNPFMELGPLSMAPKVPGLFITGTDTEVGKTVSTCLIAHALRQQGVRVGVMKPFASGCRHERDQLISEDTEALAHFAESPLPLSTISPLTYRAPLAPAVAAELEAKPPDYREIQYAIEDWQSQCDLLLIEGVGGWLVPLDKKYTVSHLAQAIGYPVLVVTRPNLGTLNHTALTCDAIIEAGLNLAGLVINGYDVSDEDLSVESNPRWLAEQNNTEVINVFPKMAGVAPHKARLPEDLLAIASATDWSQYCAMPDVKQGIRFQPKP